MRSLMHMRRTAVGVRLVGVLALAALGAACGGNDAGGGGGTPEASEPEASEPATGGGGGGGEEIEVVARDLSFEPADLTAAAGSITITLNNEGQAPHNINIADLEAATEVLDGGTSGEVTFDAEAGTYDFICDVHPAEMKGTLTVS